MIRKTVTLQKDYGADIIPWLVQSACHYDCSLRIESQEKSINMKSIMGMTILRLQQGSSFDLIAEGSDETKAADEIAACFE
ncbi:MAG: HPr family phosphocarrier protein [Lachnospiraceae bacterium]|nr:HPr family phosphocarrier protein [Lachnospiraceae bacterium]